MLERIGNCRIVEEVASGGMAVVYRAVQDPLGRTVAIKALKTAAAAEENVATRFEREAKSLANLQHENIIHVYDFHHERGAMFIVMEYVQGIDLYDLLEKCGRLPYDVAADHRDAGRARARLRALPRHRPSRHQARERHDRRAQAA